MASLEVMLAKLTKFAFGIGHVSASASCCCCFAAPPRPPPPLFPAPPARQDRHH
jgi:hypothetical protein